MGDAAAILQFGLGCGGFVIGSLVVFTMPTTFTLRLVADAVVFVSAVIGVGLVIVGVARPLFGVMAAFLIPVRTSEGRLTTRTACSFAVAVVLFLCACERDHPFRTVAVYEAPRGRYSIRIEGKGVVRAGDDHSQQSSVVLTVSPMSAPADASPSHVVLPLSLRGSQVRFGNESLTDVSEPDGGTLVVSRLLSEGGYTVHPDELDELVSAVEGVLLGPKGTFMPGQTRVLRVVSISFDR